MKDLEEKQQLIKSIQLQYNYLNKEVELDDSYVTQLTKMNERFSNTVTIVPTIEERMESLQNLIHISEQTDNISNEIRNLTTSNTHKFLAEDEEESIDSTLNEQREVINKMNSYQANLGDLNKELTSNRAYVQSKLPAVIVEKLNDAQETLKRCLNEELDRMHSLLQIQQTDEEKKTKIGTINANIQKIENLLDFENGIQSKSVQDERLHLDDIDATEYIRRLEMCKNLLNYSKQLVNELKINSTTSAASTAATTNTSTPSRPPTPLNQDHHELREIEIKLDGYENEIDMKLNEIQENSTKHKRIKEKVDEIEKRLTQIKDDRLLAELNISAIMDSSVDVQVLQAKFEKTRLDYKQITDLNDELLRVEFENKEANKKNDMRRTASSPISVNAIKQQNELNERISKCKCELKSIDVQFASKLNELREKLDEKKLIEHQKVFNKFYESIKIDLLNFDEMKERLNNELNNSLLNNSGNKKKREVDGSVNSLLDNVLLDVTINSIKEDDHSDDENDHAKKAKIDRDDIPSRNDTKSTEFVSCNSDGEYGNDQTVPPPKTPLSGNASTFGDDKESFHSIEDEDDNEIDNENRDSMESVIFNQNDTFDFDPNIKKNPFEINDESSDILIDDDSGDNEVPTSDYTLTNTPRNANDSHHEFAEPKFFILPVDSNPDNVLEFAQAEYVQTLAGDKNVSDGEYEFAEAKYFIGDENQNHSDSNDGEYEFAEPKFFTSDNLTLKVIDDNDSAYDLDKIQKQQQLENEQRLKQLQAEMREAEEKRVRQEVEEKERMAIIEAQIEEKRKQIEEEERIRKIQLDKEIEEKRLKQEAEERERLEKLEKEFEMKRKQQEELELER